MNIEIKNKGHVQYTGNNFDNNSIITIEQQGKKYEIRSYKVSSDTLTTKLNWKEAFEIFKKLTS